MSKILAVMLIGAFILLAVGFLAVAYFVISL